MNMAQYFPATYGEGRANFRSSAKDAGAALESYVNPNARGPNGEELTTDVARIGPADARRVILICSATHGVEGFCGSGIQNALLSAGAFARLPDDTAAILIHAINPYGFAHVRRVTEDNVDLNRNFVDHDDVHPPSPEYDEIHALLVPADWGKAREEANAAIMRFIAERGMWAFQQAVSGGQYSHADGMFFGGVRPTWSNGTWRAILAKHGAGKRVAFIDLHTGLGPYGFGELIYAGAPATRAHELAKQWYGDELKSTEDGTSASARVAGHLGMAVDDAIPDGRAVSIAIEYGTLPVMEVFEALRADNWLYARGDVNTDLGRAIKRQIRDALYQDKDDWKEMVTARAREILGKTIAGLEAME